MLCFSILLVSLAVMGAGAALLVPATLSLITATFQGQERARAIGIWSGVSGIGTAAGPLLGGWMLQHFWWGSVFLINVPVAALALVGGTLVLKESRAARRRGLDIPGVLLSAAGLAAVTYGLITGPDDGWGSTTVLGSLTGGVILVAVFARWELRQAEPLVEINLFRNRTFSSAVGAVTAVFFALFGASCLLSQFIQFVQGSTRSGSGCGSCRRPSAPSSPRTCQPGLPPGRDCAALWSPESPCSRRPWCCWP